jgi:hypothetical protein
MQVASLFMTANHAFDIMTDAGSEAEGDCFGCVDELPCVADRGMLC